jgi:hypothetical protein
MVTFASLIGFDELSNTCPIIVPDVDCAATDPLGDKAKARSDIPTSTISLASAPEKFSDIEEPPSEVELVARLRFSVLSMQAGQQAPHSNSTGILWSGFH